MRIKKIEKKSWEQSLYDGDITWLDYIDCTGQVDEFKQFCEDKGLAADNKAAQQFHNFILKQEEEAHTDGLD